MKKVIVLAILMVAGSLASAALQTVNYEGTVTDFGFYMGSGYNPPLFSIGDDFSVTLVYNDTDNSMQSMSYTISNLASGGGNSFTKTMTNFTGYTTSVDTSEGIFAYASRVTPSMDIWSLTFGRSAAADNFSHNSNHVGGGSEPYAWNFNASLVPEPATLALLGLGALVLRKRK